MQNKERYENLVNKINLMQKKIEPKNLSSNKERKIFAFALGLSLEVFCGIAVGLILGYYTGVWFFENSKIIKILLIVIFVILGFIAGLFNLLKRIKYFS